MSERFREFRQEPPEGLFERIAQSVEAVEAAAAQPKVVPLWRRPAVRWAGAAIAAASLLVGLFISTLRTTEQVEAELLADITVEDMVLMSEQTPTEEPMQEVVSAPAVAIATYSNHTNLTTVPTEEPNMELGTSTKQSPEEVAPTEQKADKEHTTKRSRKQRRQMKEAEEYWRNQIAQEVYYNQSSRNPIEVRLYAANSGFNDGDIQMTNVARSPMLVQEASDISNPSNTLLPEGEPLRTYAAAYMPSSLKHFMPITVGARISYSLNEWLSVESGITYTNLYSRSKNWGATNEYCRQQNQHLLGIPLALSANFIDLGPVSLYAKAGTSIDLNVSTTNSVYIDGTLVDSDPMKRHGFYYSLDVSAGASYSLWQGLGIFAEWGVSYWQSTKPQPISYRTENPFGMNIQVGLKYTFR